MGEGVLISRFSGKRGWQFLGTEVYNCQETARWPVFRHLTVHLSRNCFQLERPEGGERFAEQRLGCRSFLPQTFDWLM